MLLQHRTGCLRLPGDPQAQCPIVHLAIGEGVAADQSRTPQFRVGLCDLSGRTPARGRQCASPRQRVVEEQAGTDQPARTTATTVDRQQQAQWPSQSRHSRQPAVALAQCLSHQPEFEVLEIAEPAVQQFGRARAGLRQQPVAFVQAHAVAAQLQLPGAT